MLEKEWTALLLYAIFNNCYKVNIQMSIEPVEVHKHCVATLFIFSQWIWCAWERACSLLLNVEGQLLCCRRDIVALVTFKQGDSIDIVMILVF